MATLLPGLLLAAMLTALSGLLGLLAGFLLLTALLATLVRVILLLLITHVWLLEGPLPGQTTRGRHAPFRHTSAAA